MKLIGLTGGISSGKSTVTKIFTSGGGGGGDEVAVIDLDVIAREVVARGTRAYDEILRQFADAASADAGADGEHGGLVDEATGELDRKRLGTLVFADPGLRKKLQAITHRPIFLAMAKQLLYHFIVRTPIFTNLFINIF
jgi:dephospho-CoA kinase